MSKLSSVVDKLKEEGLENDKVLNEDRIFLMIKSVDNEDKAEAYLKVVEALEKNGITVENSTISDEELDYFTYGSDSVKDYLRVIGSYKLLTREEMDELFIRYHSGDKEAEDKLIIHNLRLVVSIAKRFVKSGIPMLDLIQEGTIGLMKALAKYDLNKGFAFSTYATWWVRQTIDRYVQDNSRLIRVPVHMCESINKVSRFSREHETIYNSAPSVEELSKATGMSKDKIDMINRIVANPPVSLSTPVGEDGDSVISDFIEDTGESCETRVENSLLAENILSDLKSTLQPKEVDVILLRYGIVNGDLESLRDLKKVGNQGDLKVKKELLLKYSMGSSLTLEEVGTLYGVTRERIRQIEKRAMEKLMRSPKFKGYKSYVKY